MTNDEQFGRSLSAWLDEEARSRVPAHLAEVLVHTTATRQRAWWSSPERWLPVQTTLRLSPAPRVIWILVVLALVIALGAVGALVVGSRQHPLPPPFGPARNGVIVYGGLDLDIHALDLATGVTTSLVAGSEGDIVP